MLHSRPLVTRGAAAAAAVLLAGCEPPATVTFNRDVAPVVFENCAPCHRPGGAAPFSLLDYGEARIRSRQIAQVTASRFMPPWLPEPGLVDFADERRLTDAEIALLQTWHEEGAVEGDPDDLPPLPEFPAGWYLGEPDRVVEMPEPFALPAEGPDVFRNFVIPAPVDGRRWVRAVEIRPRDPRVVHHAVLQVDDTRSTRELDARDPGPGFEGMYMGESYMPGGQFIGWTPGKVPSPGTPGVAWAIDGRTDLVLQLHMPPTGKPETVRVAVGLYLTETPPTVHPFALMLSSEDIDIPAGADDYWVDDAFELPADVEVLGVYPHAHYLGEEMRAWAELPEGGRQWLLRIDHWDFNWQDDYRYAEPLRLPRGSRLVMRFRYDNTADNVDNPHSPPRRVVYGTQSSDEMANLLLEVVPATAEGRSALARASLEARLARDPDSWRARHDLAVDLAGAGDVEGAVEHLREALRLRPGEPALHFQLGTVLATAGRREAGLEHLGEAVRLAPWHADAHNHLGITLQELGRVDDAARHYRQALAAEPGHAEARHNLGAALHELARKAHEARRYAAAARLYEQALAARPDDVGARYNLGVARLMSGDVEAALPHFRQAVALRPGLLARLTELASALAAHPSNDVYEPGRAVALAELAAELSGRGDAAILETLAILHAKNGDLERAAATAEEALALVAGDAQGELATRIRGHLERIREAAGR